MGNKNRTLVNSGETSNTSAEIETPETNEQSETPETPEKALSPFALFRNAIERMWLPTVQILSRNRKTVTTLREKAKDWTTEATALILNNAASVQSFAFGLTGTPDAITRCTGENGEEILLHTGKALEQTALALLMMLSSETDKAIEETAWGRQDSNKNAKSKFAGGSDDTSTMGVIYQLTTDNAGKLKRCLRLISDMSRKAYQHLTLENEGQASDKLSACFEIFQVLTGAKAANKDGSTLAELNPDELLQLIAARLIGIQCRLARKEASEIEKELNEGKKAARNAEKDDERAQENKRIIDRDDDDDDDDESDDDDDEPVKKDALPTQAQAARVPAMGKMNVPAQSQMRAVTEETKKPTLIKGNNNK